MTRDKIVVIAGNYDILGLDDVEFIKKCKSKGDWLIVGLHSDVMVHLTSNNLYNSYDTRYEILRSLKHVDEVLKFNDSDGTYCRLLKSVKLFYPNSDITFITTYDMHNTPETKIRGITFETIN